MDGGTPTLATEKPKNTSRRAGFPLCDVLIIGTVSGETVDALKEALQSSGRRVETDSTQQHHDAMFEAALRNKAHLVVVLRTYLLGGSNIKPNFELRYKSTALVLNVTNGRTACFEDIGDDREQLLAARVLASINRRLPPTNRNRKAGQKR